MNWLGPKYLKTRIGKRFFTLLLIISIGPLLVMRWLAIQRSEAAIADQTVAVLRAASDGAEAELREFLGQLQERLVQITRDKRVYDAAHDLAGPNAPGIGGDLSQILSTMIPSDAQEILIVSASGDLLASAPFGGRVPSVMDVEHLVRGAEALYAGDVYRDLSTGRLTWIMSAPIKDLRTLKPLAVAAFRIDPGKLSELTSGRRFLAKGANSQSFRMGATGETYIVNRQGLMITESRYVPNAALSAKMDTLPVRSGLNGGHEITDRYADYRGVVVNGSSTLIQNPPWILITEMDFTQAFAPLKRLHFELIVAMFCLVATALVFASSSTWRVLNPIRLLSESDRALAERDREHAFVPEVDLPDDEIGDLVRMRNSRVRAVFDYQKQLEERTLKLQEMIGEIEHISYAIVHDMRAPLRAMQGFASILLESDSSRLTAEEARSFLTKISQAAVRLDHLIQDVLTYNKTALRRSPLRSVDLGPLLRGILETHPNLSSENVDITIEGEMPIVIGNEALLAQCFSNILDNAIKFSQPNRPPRVRIWSEPSPGPVRRAPALENSSQFVRIWIEDNGVGISAGAQTRIFDLFQRHSSDQRGTGIGLAIVRKVVEQMSGAVGVESEVGKGSRFWVTFLRASSDASSQAGVSGTIDSASV